MTVLSSILEPIKINNVEIKNRMVLGAASIASPNPDGTPSDETVAFYENRCQGGIGMIITGLFMSTSHGWNGATHTNSFFRIDDDIYIKAAKKIPEATHKYGVPVVAQLLISEGRMGKTGEYFSAASSVGLKIPEESLACILSVPGGVNKPAPRSSDIDEVRRLRDETIDSALRCLEAGFDGIEIGAQMSYYIATFLSKRTNLRTDEYGGSTQNRARLVVELIEAIRSKTSKEFIIGVRMSANEHTDGGQGPEEYSKLAKIFEDSGADYIALTDGAYESPDVGIEGSAALYRHGEIQFFMKNLSIPVMIQSVHDPVFANKIIEEKQADIVMFVRPLIVDPQLPNKVSSNRLDEIIKCDLNNECFRRIMMALPMGCPHNPKFGNEKSQENSMDSLKNTLKKAKSSLILKSSKFKKIVKIASYIKN